MFRNELHHFFCPLVKWKYCKLTLSFFTVRSSQVRLASMNILKKLSRNSLHPHLKHSSPTLQHFLLTQSFHSMKFKQFMICVQVMLDQVIKTRIICITPIHGLGNIYKLGLQTEQCCRGPCLHGYMCKAPCKCKEQTWVSSSVPYLGLSNFINPGCLYL